MVKGTPHYMSPEQVRGQKIDARTDIWSLGVVIYEMVTNVAPFRGETPNHAIVAVLEKEPEPLTRHSESAPAELERIVYKALQKNPEERYQTIKDLALDLKNLKQELEVEVRLRRSAGQPADGPVASVKQAVKTDFRAAMSKAEYGVREISRRKREVLVFLVAALVIAAAAIAYFIQEGTPTVSVEDSRLDYLQGLRLLRQEGDESHDKARAFFESAIDKDKNNALAWAGLSDYYGLAANLGVLEPNKAWPRAEEYAGKAAAIDLTRGEDHGEVHEALGAVRMYYHRDWLGAETEFITARRLAPDFRDTYQPYLRLLRVMGRFDEALNMNKEASDVAPNVHLARPGMRPATIYYLQGRYDQAIEESKKWLEKTPTAIEALTILGTIYAQQGKREECLETASTAETAARNSPTRRARPLAAVGYIYAACGDKAKARKILEDVKGKIAEWHNLSYSIAAIHTALEDKGEAFRWLERAVNEHTHDVIELKTDPRFEPLRKDPGFAKMLALLKLTPAK
jgi:tetratricopeptide (TPR) repeat protein